MISKNKKQLPLKMSIIILLLIFKGLVSQTTPAPASTASTTSPSTTKTDTSAAPATASNPFFTSLPCHSEITKSYGLDGIKNSQPNDINMCPGMMNSCCTTSDVITIYESWTAESGKPAIKSRFEFYQKQFQTVVKTMKQVVDVAEPLSVSYVNNTNCKMMALVISQFNVKEMETQFELIQKEMHRFLMKNYKGFWCSICDAKQHVYMDLTKLLVQVSGEYCRNLIKSSLGTLWYYHVGFPKLLNLMVDFVSSCDATGNYVPVAVDPEELQISSPSTLIDSLDKCKNRINKFDYLNACQDICIKNSLVGLDKFFYPHLKTYRKMTSFINTGITVLEQAATAAKMNLGGGSDKVKKSSKAEIDKLAGVTQSKKGSKMTDDKVVKMSATPAVAKGVPVVDSTVKVQSKKGSLKTERRLQGKLPATSSTKPATTGTPPATASTPPATTGTTPATAGIKPATTGTVAAALPMVTPPLISTDPWKLYLDPIIITPGLNKIINVEDMKLMVDESGFDQTGWGERSLLEKNAMQIAKQKLKFEAMGGGMPYCTLTALAALGLVTEKGPADSLKETPKAGAAGDSKTPVIAPPQLPSLQTFIDSIPGFASALVSGGSTIESMISLKTPELVLFRDSLAKVIQETTNKKITTTTSTATKLKRLKRLARNLQVNSEPDSDQTLLAKLVNSTVSGYINVASGGALGTPPPVPLPGAIAAGGVTGISVTVGGQGRASGFGWVVSSMMVCVLVSLLRDW